MVSEEPVSPTMLAELLGVGPKEVEDICSGIQQDLISQKRGFMLTQIAGGYMFQTHPDLDEFVKRFVLDSQSSKLSAPALETLAIVAYKQPISRAQIASIRGVNVDGVVRMLVNRRYIAPVGKDSGPGQALLFGTTEYFLESLGLNSLQDLPKLDEFMPNKEVIEELDYRLGSVS